MKIKDYAKIYFNQPKEKRDINEWVPVLDAFIGNFCLKYINIGTQEDRVQVAWIGAIKAIDSYDISKEIQFTTFLSKCMRNELLMFNRSNNRKNQPFFVSLAEPLVEDASLTIEDSLSDDSYLDYDKMIESNRWNYFIEYLCSPQEVKVLKRRMDGKTQKEIADEFGWSGQGYVSRLLHKCSERYKNIAY